MVQWLKLCTSIASGEDGKVKKLKKKKKKTTKPKQEKKKKKTLKLILWLNFFCRQKKDRGPGRRDRRVMFCLSSSRRTKEEIS